jgi:hypothetical protein
MSQREHLEAAVLARYTDATHAAARQVRSLNELVCWKSLLMGSPPGRHGIEAPGGFPLF